MKKLLLLLIPALCLTLGCHFTKPGTLKNDKIDKSIRDVIQNSNEALVSALMRGDITSFKNMESEALHDKMNKATDSLIMENGKKIMDFRFKILDEYYTKLPFQGKKIEIENNARKGQEYTVTYQALNKESYASLLVVNIDSSYDALITVVYGKYGSDWKINIIYFGDYSRNGKNVKSLFAAAKKDMKDSNIVDAYVNISMAKNCAAPAPGIVRFKCDSSVLKYSDFVDKIADGKYGFPITVNSINTKPVILTISTIYERDRGVMPLVCYKTDILFTDVKALKSENDLLKKAIGTLFKGIDQNKKYVAYRILNTIPQANEHYQYYNIVDNLMRNDD